MNNYNFEKKIYKNGTNYCLELELPNNFNNFFYKIYGNDGFYTYGKYSCYKNNDSNNSLLLNINTLQILCISIILNKKNTEYYDFINMSDFIKNVDDIKNIKLKIERNITPFNIKLINNIDEDADEDTSSSDEETSNSDEEISSNDEETLSNDENI